MPQLWSLYDMLRDYSALYELSGTIHEILAHTRVMRDSKISKYDSQLKPFQDVLVSIQRTCEQYGYAHTAEMARLAAERTPETYGDLYHELTHLNDSLTRELKRDGLLRIGPERKDYYAQQSLFGPEVTEAFSKCAHDIRKAGNCYALALPDACVHHLMLVLERGLNALATKVSVPYERTNWQDVINNIAAKLKTMPKGSEKDFYLEVNAQFGFLKDAYRNHAEHVHDNPSDMPRALSTLNHVRSFMQALAKGGLTE